jgi:hypothetical protein
MNTQLNIRLVDGELQVLNWSHSQELIGIFKHFGVDHRSYYLYYNSKRLDSDLTLDDYDDFQYKSNVPYELKLVQRQSRASSPISIRSSSRYGVVERLGTSISTPMTPPLSFGDPMRSSLNDIGRYLRSNAVSDYTKLDQILTLLTSIDKKLSERER